MAAVTAARQADRSGSLSWCRRRSGATVQRSSRLLDSSVLLLLALAATLHCAAADGKTLVLLDNLNIRDTHSIFFRSLAGQWHTRAAFIHNSLLLHCFMNVLLHISECGAGGSEFVGWSLMQDS